MIYQWHTLCISKFVNNIIMGNSSGKDINEAENKSLHKRSIKQSVSFKGRLFSSYLYALQLLYIFYK